MRRFLIVLFILALAISACSARQEDSAASLIGTWQLTSYGSTSDPAAVVPDSGAQIIFNDDGSVGGNSGCNDFGGKYSVEGDEVTFSEVVSTLKACEEPLMAQEEAIHQVLNGTATYTIEGGTLTLVNGDRVLVLSR